MKTHFAILHYGNESNPSDEWSDPVCNTQTAGDIKLSNDWKYVDCKRCIRGRKQFEGEMKAAMEHSVKDMEGFVNFMENNG